MPLRGAALVGVANRYRPYAVIVVAALLITLVPARSGTSRRSVTTSAGAAVGPATAESESTPSSDSATVGPSGLPARTVTTQAPRAGGRAGTTRGPTPTVAASVAPTTVRPPTRAGIATGAVARTGAGVGTQ